MLPVPKEHFPVTVKTSCLFVGLLWHANLHRHTSNPLHPPSSVARSDTIMPSPIVTASLQATALSAASNLIAQITRSFTKKIAFSFDVNELLRFIVLTIITTPPNYKWQQFLERTFPAHHPSPGRSLPLTHKDARKRNDEVDEDMGAPPKSKLNIKNTLLKWFIDCMTVGALVNTVAFLILMGCLKGQSADQISTNVKTETFTIIVNSYKIWPVASIVNFAFVPVEKRIVFLSSVGLFWGVYLSLVASSV